MRLLITASLLVFSTATLAQSITELFCDETKKVIAEAQGQLPVQVDVATQWIGASALYVGGKCHVNYGYFVDSESIINITQRSLNQRGADTSRQDLVNYYASEEGSEDIKETTRADSEEYFADALAIPNVQIRLRYDTSEPIRPFTIVLESE